MLSSALCGNPSRNADDLHTSPRGLAISRLVPGLTKKYVRVTDGNDTSTPAIQLWIAMNEKCKSTNSSFKENMDSCQLLRLVLTEAKAIIEDWFGASSSTWTLPISECVQELRPGPGANQGVKGTDFYTKLYDSPLTYSCEGLYTLYQSLVKQNPSCFSAEQIRHKKHGKDDRVLPGKVTTVPKTNVIDRVILVEPSLNTLFQLGTEAYLRKILRRGPGIDLVSQPDINRELARLGSTERSDQWGKLWATIDLSSASDTICIELVKYLLPTSVYEWLNFISTRKAITPSGDIVELEMMSSMGNGTTFPLQTLLFSSICAAILKLNGVLFRHDGRLKYDFSVFGDDIIIDCKFAEQLCAVLEQCGFIVNRDKSYWKGGFRESCGTDWYHGYNVRPVYCNSLSNPQEIISLINRLNRWSAQHSVPIPRSIGVLLDAIGRKDRYLVPNYESDDAGIHVGLTFAQSVDKKSVGFVPQINSALSFRLGGCVDSIVYRIHQPRKLQKSFWVRVRNPEDITSRILILDPKVNPDGVYCSILAGSVRGTGVAVRMRRVTYVSSFAFSPGWGCGAVYGGLTIHWSHSYRHWEMTVQSNLASLQG